MNKKTQKRWKLRKFYLAGDKKLLIRC